MNSITGKVIDVVREREGYNIYVRYSEGGKVYIAPTLNLFKKPQFILSQEVQLNISEEGVSIV